MRRIVVGAAALGAAATGGALWWRRHPRFGTTTVNRVINPWLVRQGVGDVTRGEIGLLEHVGRVSGTVRLTPVHPVETDEGIRIVVPLGSASEWARNVLAAGHCRLQRGERVLELDAPRLVDPRRIDGVPGAVAPVMSWLGFRYLVLRRFAEHVGSLEETVATASEREAAPAPVA